MYLIYKKTQSKVTNFVARINLHFIESKICEKICFWACLLILIFVARINLYFIISSICEKIVLGLLLIPIKLSCQNLLYELSYFSTFTMLTLKHASMHYLLSGPWFRSGCTRVHSIEECAIFSVCIVEHRPPTWAVTIHKTCTDQQWDRFQDSARIQDQRSMCWQHTLILITLTAEGNSIPTSLSFSFI